MVHGFFHLSRSLRTLQVGGSSFVSEQKMFKDDFERVWFWFFIVLIFSVFFYYVMR